MQVNISLLNEEVEQGSAARSEGGAWQGFQFDEMSLTWIRISDLRHALSTLFTTSIYSTDKEIEDNTAKDDFNGPTGIAGCTGSAGLAVGNLVNDINPRWEGSVRNGAATSSSTSFSTSLESSQAAAARWGNFNLSEILKITRAALDGNNDNNNNNNNNNNYNNTKQHTQDISMMDWSALVTSSYLEERVSLCFSLNEVRGVSEWVGRWIHDCCMVRTYVCMYVLYFVWCGVVWCGVVWCGVVWCGVVRCDVV